MNTRTNYPAGALMAAGAKNRDPLYAAPTAQPAPPTFSDATILPDGSAFATASWPLPKDHWLYAPRGEWDNKRDEYAECPEPILNNSHKQAVRAAIKYAVRGATMCGQEMDFDPDAMVQNAVYALCGPANAAVLPVDAQPAPLECQEQAQAVAAAYCRGHDAGWQSRATHKESLTVAAAPLPAREPVACVTECEACFTPDACQLRGTCDHYAASQLRIATTAQPAPQWIGAGPEGAVVCRACGRPPESQRASLAQTGAEPVAWLYEVAGCKPTASTNYVPGVRATPLYAAPLPAREPLTGDQHIALREAHCIGASDAYFEVRPAHDHEVNRLIFEHGFTRGFDSHNRLMTRGIPAATAEKEQP